MNTHRRPARVSLNILLKPLCECMTPEVAMQIASFEPSPDILTRLEDYAELVGSGPITSDERDQFALLVQSLNTIGVMQSRMRRFAREAVDGRRAS